MKTPDKIPAILILGLIAAGFAGCEKKIQDPELSGSLELFINASDLDESALKSLEPDSLDISRFHALLTVTGEDSLPVLDDELLPLYKFGDGFFTEKIELNVGRYRLMKFLIIDSEGVVVYAAPLKNAPRAYLVKDPLPMGFKIEPDITTRLKPEVLPVHGEPPSEFGYTSFGFTIIKPLPFFIAVMIDDPMIMAPAMYTGAALMVYHPDGWSHEFYLEAMINRVVIRGGADHYKLVVKKEGFEPRQLEVSARELMATTEGDPLIVRLGPGLQVLRLQPGPDAGFDAMISNLEPEKNFGDHPYFEATFISEPILAVMRENRSLIRFSPTGLPKSAVIKKVTLTLFYDAPLPFPWDSILPVDPYVDNEFAWCGGVLQQIVEPWEEHGVTWKSQPKTIEANQVYISPFIRNVNFIEVDVSRLFVPEQEIAAPNYGMLFRLAPTPQFPGFRFASSDCKEPGMRPLLKIFYVLPLD